MIQGKIINKKKHKNYIFLIINNNFGNSRLVIDLNQVDEKNVKDLCVGDVIECNAFSNDEVPEHFDFEGSSYNVKTISIISKHIEEAKFSPNVNAISDYSKIKIKARNFLDEKNYIEIPIPTLTNDEVSSSSDSFKTYHDKTKRELYLIKSMDPFLRILSCSGMDKIYGLTNIYRNEHISSWRQPIFEMLSVYSNYFSQEDTISLCLKLFENIGFEDNDKLQIISNFTNDSNSNSKKIIDDNCNDEFKIKYKDKTIAHGVNEICNIEEYIEMLERQGKSITKGDLEILRNCIASGAVPCYSVGISLQRILALEHDIKLDDVNPFPFSRIKKVKR